MSHDFYKINPFTSNVSAFNLLYITQSKYDKDWHSTPHTHHFTELFYIVSGKGAFMLPGYEIPVKENDLVIINPNVEHTEKSNRKDSLEYIALGIEGISFTLPGDDAQIGLFTYQGDQKDILFYLHKLLEEVQFAEHNYETVCHNIIEILITKLRRDKKLTVQKKDSKPLNQSVAQVKHYIKQNYDEPLTLDMLAKVSNVNKYYLSHMFKGEIGVSPIDYLNKIRIEKTKNLLETTDLTIADIASFNGFSSQSFFSQAFKKKEGMTPSQYRKRYHILNNQKQYV